MIATKIMIVVNSASVPAFKWCSDKEGSLAVVTSRKKKQMNVSKCT